MGRWLTQFYKNSNHYNNGRTQWSLILSPWKLALSADTTERLCYLSIDLNSSQGLDPCADCHLSTKAQIQDKSQGWTQQHVICQIKRLFFADHSRWWKLVHSLRRVLYILGLGRLNYTILSTRQLSLEQKKLLPSVVNLLTWQPRPNCERSSCYWHFVNVWVRTNTLNLIWLTDSTFWNLLLSINHQSSTSYSSDAL